jgi:hypothetical protein
MIAYLFGGALLAVLTIYTVTSVLSYLPPVDRWLRARRVGKWPLRSLLPFWGLFAQAFGMFDLDIWCRVVGNQDGNQGETGDWRKLTEGHRQRWSSLWRPHQRVDQTGQVLAFRILRAGGLHGDREVASSPAYQRVADRARLEFAPTVSADRAIADGDRIQFCIQLSRGHWTATAPITVFTSRAEQRNSLPEGVPEEGRTSHH